MILKVWAVRQACACLILLQMYIKIWNQMNNITEYVIFLLMMKNNNITWMRKRNNEQEGRAKNLKTAGNIL